MAKTVGILLHQVNCTKKVAPEQDEKQTNPMSRYMMVTRVWAGGGGGGGGGVCLFLIKLP